ncbi:3-phosphoinositide-dependent protein kinase 1 [Chlorella vulgaris]
MCPTPAIISTTTVVTMAESEPLKPAPKVQQSLADFELLRRIGDGSYSHVVLARHRASNKEYALKVVDKQYIVRHRVVDYIRRERQILDTLQYDGIATLFFTFQDAYSLYMGLEYCPNGELYDQIRLQGRLPEASAAVYAAEVVLMLEHLRSHRIVHRDLKPENLLLDAQGHLKLIDFGSAKQLGPDEAALPAEAAAHSSAGDEAADGAAADSPEAEAEAEAGGKPDAAAQEAGTAEPAAQASPGDAPVPKVAEVAEVRTPFQSEAGSKPGQVQEERAKRAVSLVGTADYVSPEILNNCAVTTAADLWALGCVAYQMLSGRPPFKSPSEYVTFQKIVDADYEMPKGISQAAADLLRGLLQVEPANRIGAADLAELKAHPFFEKIDWQKLRSQPAPEFVPDLEPSMGSASSSFDWELQSLASALPPTASGVHAFELE